MLHTFIFVSQSYLSVQIKLVSWVLSLLPNHVKRNGFAFLFSSFHFLLLNAYSDCSPSVHLFAGALDGFSSLHWWDLAAFMNLMLLVVVLEKASYFWKGIGDALNCFAFHACEFHLDFTNNFLPNFPWIVIYTYLGPLTSLEEFDLL